MKVKIIKSGKTDKKTGKELKIGQVISIDEKRAERAIKNGNAEKVAEPEKKESTQDKVSKKTTKK